MNRWTGLDVHRLSSRTMKATALQSSRICVSEIGEIEVTVLSSDDPDILMLVVGMSAMRYAGKLGDVFVYSYKAGKANNIPGYTRIN